MSELMVSRRHFMKIAAALGIAAALPESIENANAVAAPQAESLDVLLTMVSDPNIEVGLGSLQGDMHIENYGGGYRRAKLGSMEYADGSITNAASIVFPEPTSDWPILLNEAYFFDADLQEPIAVIPLGISRYVRGGDFSPTFAPRSLTISFV